MTMSADTPRENLTLSEADLAACRPIVGEGGHVLRALCPFHGSDRQRRLRVQMHSGRFVCFACGAWGYMDTARAQWRAEHQRQAAFRRPSARRQREPHRRQPPPPLPRQPAAAARTCSADPPAPREPTPSRPDPAPQLATFQAALPGSSSGASSPARPRCGARRLRCCRQQPMAGTKMSTRPRRRGCWRSGSGLQRQPREARCSPYRRTCENPGLNGSPLWWQTAASRARPPSASRGSGSRPQAQRREGSAAAPPLGSTPQSPRQRRITVAEAGQAGQGGLE
jgi:hypothetical protein